MKRLRHIKCMLFIVFVIEVFLGQLITWVLINNMGTFNKSIGCMVGIVFVMTIVTCFFYIFFRKLYYRYKRIDRKSSLAEELYEISNIIYEKDK